MGNDKVYDEASVTEPVDGNVAVMGPNGVSVTLSPEAAIETSDRLMESALIAAGQRVEANWSGEGRPAQSSDGE